MKDTFVMNKIFCCPGFQHLVGDAGQRGLAVLVVKTSEGIRFRLQSRGIAFEDVSKIRPAPDYPDIKINVACESGLQFCPFCGRRLQELLQASPEAFGELAERHKEFYTGP
jgi:hypothetical protein